MYSEVEPDRTRYLTISGFSEHYQLANIINWGECSESVFYVVDIYI
jgi:hypothetical protein